MLFRSVLNQTPVRGRRIDEAAQALGGDAARDMSDVLARPFIAMRNDHQDALALGLAVSEYAPTGKSAEEIALLWRWAEARLNGGALKFAAHEGVSVPALRSDAAQKAESATAQSPAGDEALTPWDACL